MYAKSQGRTPKDQLEHDREEYPGGCMTGFMMFINRMSSEFCKKHSEYCMSGGLGDRIINHDKFDQYIQCQIQKTEES